MKQFNTDIPEFNDLVNVGFVLHNHICPAMPLGLRAGLTALRKLNVSRSQNKELKILMENGPNHAALCFSEGVQVATSCTFGKGNIIRTDQGKNAFTLIDQRNNKAVRISIKYPFFQKMLSSEFVQKRKAGIEPYNIDESIAPAMIQSMLDSPEENIFSISKIFDVESEKVSGTFNYGQCETCKEPVFETGLRKKNNQVLCLNCANE